MKTVAIDFDGVIHAYSKGWQDGSIYDEPLPGALDAIRGLMAQGIAVFVHTTRDAGQVAGWLEKHLGCDVFVADRHMEFWNDATRLLVSNRKLPAVAYIDDRAIRFASWDQALADLGTLEGITRGP